MERILKEEGKYRYVEIGEGTPIVILHGLMGSLSNFDGVADYFPKKSYKVIMPELPIYAYSLLKTNVKAFAKFVYNFVQYKGYDKVILLGNSLGVHIALVTAKLYPQITKELILTASSGPYEQAMGDSSLPRGNSEFIQKNAQDVFYVREVATPEI